MHVTILFAISCSFLRGISFRYNTKRDRETERQRDRETERERERDCLRIAKVSVISHM